MDTVTYPDPRVQAALKDVVCCRVEFDKDPARVKQYGVKPLPDVRILDADAKELTKLTGPISAARLLARLQGASEAGVPPVRDVNVTPEAIEGAVATGVAFLRSSLKSDGLAKISGQRDQILYALAAAGETDDELVKAVLQEPLADVYQVAFQSLALQRLDAKKYHDRLEACAKFILENQLENGQWSYRGKGDQKVGDNSNSAYAILGLYACSRAGIDLPKDAIERAEMWWIASQNPDGGWGYRADRETDTYASMTENGIASVTFCNRLGTHVAADDDAMKTAPGWLMSHYAVDRNTGSAYQEGRLLYHLYALERAATIFSLEKITGHDWYNEGAARLLGTQRDDGSWDDGAGTPESNTSFAILFLTRSTRALR